MPRRIDFDNMEWADERYGRNELGVGGVEIVDGGEYSFSFLKNGGLENATKHCGLFSADIQDEDSPREDPNALADEIFSWAEANLSGKWLVFEGFAYRYSVGYQNYVIENETDRQKFQAQWGHIFEYTEPSAVTREPALSQYEHREQEQVQTKLRAAWDATRQVLPLYGYSAQSWLFVAARIDGKDRLFIVPEDERAAIEARYGITIEPNKVKHMGNILNGQNDLEAGADFTRMVSEMFHRYGRDMLRAREVSGFRFGCFINGCEDSVERRGMDEYGRIFSYDEDLSYDGEGTTLQDVRDAYQKGRTVSFFLKDVSFTYDTNAPLVSYRENTRHGIAITPQNGGFYSGVHGVNVSGFYKKDTGLAHGKWRHNNATIGNTGDGGCSPNHEALYDNGQLVTGSLGGDGSRFQPAAPNTRIIGPKIR